MYYNVYVISWYYANSWNKSEQIYSFFRCVVCPNLMCRMLFMMQMAPEPGSWQASSDTRWEGQDHSSPTANGKICKDWNSVQPKPEETHLCAALLRVRQAHSLDRSLQRYVESLFFFEWPGQSPVPRLNYVVAHATLSYTTYTTLNSL